MIIRLLASCVLAASLVWPAGAQTAGDGIRGTWSGDWVLEDAPRDRVTVEFRWEGDSLTGRMINPRQLDLTSVAFDESTRTIVAEAADPEGSGTYRIEATVEGTRMNGTMSYGSASGELRLTKWTYVPRPRY